MSEFDLIKTHFTWEPLPESVRVGVGDDAAVLLPDPEQEWLISVDTLVNGVHFPLDTAPQAIGHKALAVNLSDLAAMGADPRWFTLALTVPEANPDWLAGFAQGLRQLAQQHGIFLIGGDTTRGPLSITLQVMGSAPRGKALLRSGAQPGDLLCVSGTLGDAAAGLAVLQQRRSMPAEEAAYCIERLNYPTPRLALGQWLRTHASSCMDISDGLLADLLHLLKRSRAGAQLQHQQLPFSRILEKIPLNERLNYALTGGDDYELLFTLPAGNLKQLHDYNKKNSNLIRIIGHITPLAEKIELDLDFHPLTSGYNHFL